MNPVISALVVLAVIGVVSGNQDWNSFKSQHGKNYATPLEETMRKAIFMANKRYIEEFNAKEASKAGFTMGLSHLSDLTREEVAQRNGLRMPSERLTNSPKADRFLANVLSRNVEVPDTVDWRTVAGRVGAVKDQGQCGSCWAFSATGALEGQMVVRNKSLDLLSEQNLVDCSKANHGCQGGVMLYAWEDIKTEGGIDDQSTYPYTAVHGKCKFNKNKVVFNDDDGCMLPQGDEDSLKEMVAKFGPVSVGIDASQPSFAHYQSGVYFEKKCSATSLDHGVLVVGYGTDKKDGDYWLVKNSWGSSWGDNGYIKMARNKNNHCGIATIAMIPTF